MTTRGRRTRSLKQLATVAWISAIVALVVGVVVVWIGFTSLLTARQRSFDRLQPALVSTQALRTSMVDQETGLRGYALTRDERFLEPYDQGAGDEVIARNAIRDALAGDEASASVRAQLEVIERGMESWRTYVAEPLLEAPVDPIDIDEVFLRSRASFDRVRTEVDDLQELLEAEQAEAGEELDATTSRLVLSVGAAVTLLGLVSLVGSWVLRRRVVDPIEELVSAADAVAADRLDQPIAVEGPVEIEQLALRVSEMRDRIVTELAIVEASRVELDRRAEDLARSNADLEQFAYVASHDLQEPLRKVASFCQLLEQRYGDELDERGRSYIEFAVDGAKRMQALIADLLEFSRLGRTTGSFVPCDLAAIAQDVRDELAEDLRGATVTVGPLPTLLGDPTLYRALLQNLIGNAIKYRRGTDPPTIALTAVRDGETWTFSCADRGIGIEPAYRDRVFAIFQRLHGRGEFDGTGIGLALCKKIVEFCGGRIWIDEPDDGIGTVVRWTLPALPTGPGLAAPALDGPDEHDEDPPPSDAPPSTTTPPVSTAPSPQPTSGTR